MGDITKLYIRKTIAVVLCMAAICLAFSQNTQNETANPKEIEKTMIIGNNSSGANTTSATTDANGQITQGSTGENSTNNENSGSSGLSTWDTVGLFVRMILVLILVIACIYFIVWLLRRSMRPGVQNDPYLKKTASITLSPGKTVQVVTLQDKAYLLGVSDSSITLISEITDKELIDTMNLNAPAAGGKKTADFASLLSSLTGSAKRTGGFLKSRRQKLRGEDGEL
ncbi:MAG: flagellar biosynthetic protein FliO [Spirochaetaceae bacterium]|nr:flagellar biosynthetic protein FliO [Spirochaetaceae bacterium]